MEIEFDDDNVDEYFRALAAELDDQWTGTITHRGFVEEVPLQSHDSAVGVVYATSGEHSHSAVSQIVAWLGDHFDQLVLGHAGTVPCPREEIGRFVSLSLDADIGLFWAAGKGAGWRARHLVTSANTGMVLMASDGDGQNVSISDIELLLYNLGEHVEYAAGIAASSGRPSNLSALVSLLLGFGIDAVMPNVSGQDRLPALAPAQIVNHRFASVFTEQTETPPAWAVSPVGDRFLVSHADRAELPSAITPSSPTLRQIVLAPSWQQYAVVRRRVQHDLPQVKPEVFWSG